jgi:hypothetical protein
MKLWQFRLRNLCDYACITVDENLEIGQMIRIIKQAKKDGYLTWGCERWMKMIKPKYVNLDGF